MLEPSLEELFVEALSIKKQIDALTSKLSGSILGKVEEAIPVKFKDLNFKCLLVYGYTPNFNDGDPCTHNFYVNYGKNSVNGRDDFYLDFDNDLEDFEEFFSDEGIDYEDVDLNIGLIPLISEEDRKVIESFFDGFNFLCEHTGLTNFKIKIYKKEDGEILVEVDDEYYCY